jgi:hypothetical protein
MYQVTAIYQNSEIGYGEGEGIDYSIEECIDSIPEMFKFGAEPNEIELLILHPNGKLSKFGLQDHLQIMDTLKYIG